MARALLLFRLSVSVAVDISAPITHYSNPFLHSCMPEEQNITFQSSISGFLCSQQCDYTTPFSVDGDKVICPLDVPDDVQAVPSCISHNEKNFSCVLLCTPGIGECGDYGTCENFGSGHGICTYSAIPKVKFVPKISHQTQAIVGIGTLFFMVSCCILRDFCQRDSAPGRKAKTHPTYHPGKG